MKLISLPDSSGQIIYIDPEAVAYVVPGASKRLCHVALKGSEESFPVAAEAAQVVNWLEGASDAERDLMYSRHTEQLKEIKRLMLAGQYIRNVLAYVAIILIIIAFRLFWIH